MKRTVTIHNGSLTWQFAIDGKKVFLIQDLVAKLAIEAGYEVKHTGNGKEDFKEEK
jgi:hypothetical protein